MIVRIMLACSIASSSCAYAMNRSATPERLPYYTGYRLRALMRAEDPGVQCSISDRDVLDRLSAICPRIRLDLGVILTPDQEFGAIFVTRNGGLQACLVLLNEQKVCILKESSFSLDAQPTAHFISRESVCDLVIRSGISELWYATKTEEIKETL